MQTKALYKSFHSHLRRALNAGAQGYLNCQMRGGSWREEDAFYAAQAAVRATGRQPAATRNHALFYAHNYLPKAS